MMNTHRAGISMPFVLAIVLCVTGLMVALSQSAMLGYTLNRDLMSAQQHHWTVRAGVEWLEQQEDIDWTQPVVWEIPSELTLSESLSVEFQKFGNDTNQRLQIQLYQHSNEQKRLITTQNFARGENR